MKRGKVSGVQCTGCLKFFFFCAVFPISRGDRGKPMIIQSLFFFSFEKNIFTDKKVLLLLNPLIFADISETVDGIKIRFASIDVIGTPCTVVLCFAGNNHLPRHHEVVQ